MSRNHEITFRASQEEIQKLRVKAKQLGLTLSAFCRMISLSAKIEVTE